MTRSQRTRLWIRWALRDARRRWLQVGSIALLLALGVGMYSAMTSMSSWRTASADASFAALRMHDLRVSLAVGGYASEGKLAAALAQIPGRSLVTGAEERLVVPTQVDASRGSKSILVPGRIVGDPLSASVDTTATVRGNALGASDSGRPVVELERNFAKHYGLPSSGSVKLSGGIVARYAGQALAPEYFVVTAPGVDFGAEASFAVLFTSLRTAQTLSGHAGSVNELVLRVARPGDIARVQAELARSLRRALPGTGFTFTTGSEEPARRMMYQDAKGDQQMMDIFAYLLLGAAAFAAFNLVSRAVEAQRREIGIGMALGVRTSTLAIRPLMLGLQVALLGLLLGIPAGLAANSWLRGVMESFFPLPVWRTPMDVGVFAEAAGLGLVVSLLATIIPLRRALRVTPVEAIRVGARSAKGSGIAWLTRGLRLPGGSLGNMPLRNVLRAPRRTAMTVLGIGAVVAITFALAGVLSSFSATVDATRAEALNGAKQRLTVDLSAPQGARSPAVRAVVGTPAVGASQQSLRLPVTLIAGGSHIDAFVEFLPSHSPLWHPALRSGALPSDRPAIVLAAQAMKDLRLRNGQRVTMRYPMPTGAASYQLATKTMPVTGVNTTPLRYVAYANPQAAGSMGLDQLVNRVSVIPAVGHSAADVKRALLAIPAVTAVQGAAAGSDAISDSISQFTQVLVITVVIAMTMALLIAYNSAAINAEERTREHATMFAYGVGAGRVIRGNVVEAVITGALATVIGIALGYAILRWVIVVSMGDTMPDLGMLISISLLTYGLAVLAGLVSVALAPLLTLQRLRRTDIPSSLRVVE
jgi:putative ABC transport system permease protein